MKSIKRIKNKIKKLETDYSPDGKNIALIGENYIKNREAVRILKWVLQK